jgi:hypothetical protein
MAKKATKSNKAKSAGRASKAKSAGLPAKTVSRKRADGDGFSASDAIKKLLESPLVAELLAVGATAALAALAEHRFGRGGEGSSRRTSKAIKEAGKAAATAMGRRLGTEIDEIRSASKRAKETAAA